MRRDLSTIVLLGCVAACSDSAVRGDAGAIDAPRPVDAAVDARPPPGDAGRDGSLPTEDPVPYEWERVVTVGTTEDPLVYSAVSLPAGIAILATPELALYDADGVELGRTAAPATSWYATAGIARASGDLAVAYQGPGSELVVNVYSGADLIPAPSIVPSLTSGSNSLAEHNGTLYLLTSTQDGSHVITLHELNDSGIERSVVLSTGVRYSFSGPGFALSDGRIAFCASNALGTPPEYMPTILYVDPVAGTMTALQLDITYSSGDGSCRMVRAGDRIFAQWPEATIIDGDFVAGWGAAYLDGADGSVVMGPVRHPIYSLSADNGIGYTGTHFLLGHGQYIYPIDAETLAPLPRMRVTMEPGEYIPGPGRANAGDGSAGYVVIAPALGLGPIIVRLQKLEPFVAP